MKHHICWYQMISTLPCLLRPSTILLLWMTFWCFALILSSISIETPGQLLKVSLSWETSRPTKDMGKIYEKGQSSNVKNYFKARWLVYTCFVILLKSCDSCDLMLLKSMPVRCLPSAWPMNFLNPRDQKDLFCTEDSTTIGALKPESEHWSSRTRNPHLTTYCWVIHLHHAGLFSTEWLSKKDGYPFAHSQISTCQEPFDLNCRIFSCIFARLSVHPQPFYCAGSVDRKGTSHEQLCYRWTTTWHISYVC